MTVNRGLFLIGMNFTLNFVMKYFLLGALLISIYTGFAAHSKRSSVIGYRTTVIGHLSSVICHRSSKTDLNRPAFYKAMEGNNKDLVNDQLTKLSSAPSELKDAFMGAMIMKKAGLGGSPTTKLHLFKEGHKMLETAINQDPKNAEFRFLRLMIQENAPGFLGYKNDMEKDSEFIRKSYKSLPDEVQSALIDYNKKSKLLKLDVS